MSRVTGPWLNAPATQAVFACLEDAGYPAYFVGGCVRDALLGRPVKDVDISTPALPQIVVELAEEAGFKAIPTGIGHGTVTVVARGVPHEITTFRKDVATDGRHAIVAFTHDMTEDATRRDLTMNALYADRHGNVHDPLDGLDDLKAGRVRFILDAARRIEEDRLRILRFFRFFAWYGDPAAGLDPEGLAACAAEAAGIERLSAERIGAETLKLLAAPDPAPSVAAMAQAGVLARVLPGGDPTFLAPLVHLEGDRPADALRRLAVLGGEAPEDRLRLSRQHAKRLALLRDEIGSSAGIAEIAWRHGASTAWDVALLRAAVFGTPLPETAAAQIALGAEAEFPLSATDLMPDVQGAALGAALRDAEQRWIDSGFVLTRADLLR